MKITNYEGCFGVNFTRRGKDNEKKERGRRKERNGQLRMEKKERKRNTTIKEVAVSTVVQIMNGEELGFGAARVEGLAPLLSPSSFSLALCGECLCSHRDRLTQWDV